MTGRLLTAISIGCSACLAVCSFAGESDRVREECIFVRDGKSQSLSRDSTAWKQGDGYLEATGTEARLVAGAGIGPGDFRVTARLTLIGLQRSAAAFKFGENHFGFEGAHGKVFLTGGRLVNFAYGLPIGEPGDFLTDGKPFVFEAIRSGELLEFRIDGRLVHKLAVSDEPVGPIALLPWRATMRIEELRASGNISQEYVDWKPPHQVKPIDGVDKITLLPPGKDNPRNSEGDFIALKDGRVLFVYTHFFGGGGDHSAARLAGRYSSDGGRTWTGEDVTVVDNEGDWNVMSVSLLRLASGKIGLFYARKNSLTDCRPYLRISTDEAATWSEPTRLIDDQVGYYVLNNDRVVQLSSGRLLAPVALHNAADYPQPDWAGTIMCYLSDDEGRNWRRSKSQLIGATPDGKRVTLQEPGVISLKDGRLMMFCRTTSGCQYVSYSADDGDTWTAFGPSNIISPCSPASIERIPSTGDLLLVWNNHENVDAAHQGKRTPYHVAVSRDDGRTWEHIKTIEDDPHGWYCYTAVDFVGDHVLLGHCAGDRRTGGLSCTQITRFPLAWLYRPSAAEK